MPHIQTRGKQPHFIDRFTRNLTLISGVLGMLFLTLPVLTSWVNHPPMNTPWIAFACTALASPPLWIALTAVSMTLMVVEHTTRHWQKQNPTLPAGFHVTLFAALFTYTLIAFLTLNSMQRNPQ